MRHSFVAICASVIVLGVSTAHGQELRRGTVASVDEPTGSITISQMPDGTVGSSSSAAASDKFAVQDGLLFNALRQGDKVMFSSTKINGVETIVKLEKE